MNKWKKLMDENPLARVYLTILPALVAVIAVVFVLVKMISGIIAPDQLVLTATYKDYEQGAVLQTPIRVAKDEAFEKEVKSQTEKTSGFMDILVFIEGTAEKPEELAELDAPEVPQEEAPEDGRYIFSYESTNLPDTIYVKSPQWWYPVDTEGNMTAPLEVGAKMYLSEVFGPLACGDAAFEITGVETTKISSGIFNITVTMTAAGDAAASNVKLIMDDEVFEEWDGSSELSYNEETGFAERTLVFRYNRSLREDISNLVENATVMVQEYTVCRSFKDAEITANIDGIEIVQVDNH